MRPRNPLSQVKQDAARLARVGGTTAAESTRGAADETANQTSGTNDATTGEVLGFGLLDITPLDSGDGFVLG